MKQHKARYQSRGCIFMGALLFVLMLSAVVQASPFTTPKKLADYLYYMEYTDYVPDLATGERNIQPDNFWQTWHTAVYDLAKRTLRLNIQEDYSRHYDFKLN